MTGRPRAATIERLGPVGIGVEGERNQLDGTVSCCLANHCVSANNPAGRDQDSVVVSARDQRWRFVEADGELLDDLEELKCLEVAWRRLTIGPRSVGS